ncbi:MAG: hypothetical protein MJA84_16610, partial [Firmicutes bacterium]|nr:hypothetical protein [Bacillota bacterium]
EILEKVEAAKEAILEDRKLKTQVNVLQKQIDSSERQMVKKYICEFYYDNMINEKLFFELCKKIGIELSRFFIIIVEAAIENSGIEGDRFDSHDICRAVEGIELKKIRNTTVPVTPHTVAGLVCIQDGIKFDENLPVKYAYDLKRKIDKNFFINSSIGISDVGEKNDVKLGKMFSQAKQCINLQFSLGAGIVVEAQECLADCSLINNIPLNIVNKIIYAVKMGDKNFAEKNLDLLFNYYPKMSPGIELNIKNVCTDIIISLLRSLKGKGISITRFTDKCNMIYDIQKHSTWKQLREYMVGWFETIIEFDSQNKSCSTNQVVLKVLEYIKNNYM